MNRRLQETQLKKTFSTNLVNQKLSHKTSMSTFITPLSSTAGNPWSPDDVDKLEPKEFDVFKSMTDYCRFFYQRDSIASVVINKLVDIGINTILFNKNGLTENEMRIFLGLKDKLKEFAESMAMEYLLSGLVIPEVKYTVVNKEYLNELGIKKYNSLQLPTTMWLRDPKTVEIKPSVLGNEPTFFVEIPPEIIHFIISEGRYSTGEEDIELYIKLLAEYPEFVTAVKEGQTKVKLDNPLIFRRRVITGKVYPTSYLSSAVESLRHKRNLKRMDYAIAARVISAIQLFKLGSDLFPVTEEDGDVFNDIKNQMMWRDSGNRDVERVFQLFANHTLDITWVFPPTEALLDDKKYIEVNRDILMSLGVSKTLLVGEAERTGASDPELSTVSSVKTMENFRDKILIVLKNVCQEVAERNSLKTTPTIKFKPLNLTQFQAFSNALAALYSSGNISRHEYANYFGYDWDDEVDLIEDENKIMEEKKVGQFAPAPFSPTPTSPGGDQPKKPTNNPAQKPNNAK